MQSDYRTIVLGCGGIGSAALYWLSRRVGGDVLGIEQFRLGHERGGSQDHSRIIRLMYHDAAYTRLTPHTFPLWESLEEESGVGLLTRCGGLEIAHAAGPYAGDIDRYAGAMDAAGIACERLDDGEIRRRYPQFAGRAEMIALCEAGAGLVDAARGNAVHVALARARGAEVLAECPVETIEPLDDGVRVHTARGVFYAASLVIAAGAWSARLVAPLGLHLPLTVTQEQVTYFATPHLREFAPGRFPIWIWKDALDFYGFPVYGEVATKAGIDAAGRIVSADSRSFEPDLEREAQLRAFLAEHLPRSLGPTLYTKTCLYTMPPDRDFIVDRLGQSPRIWLCVGAGHAYKFASLLGQILSEMVLDGHTQHDISPFTLNRTSLQDASFAARFHI